MTLILFAKLVRGFAITIAVIHEVLLVQLLRADFGRKAEIGIVAALRDKRMAKALTVIHAAPGQNRTIESAADGASMSRSGFARRFNEVLGTSFFDYLTRLRMRDARRLLTTTNLAVADVAAKVGYQSDLSFVKVFKKTSRFDAASVSKKSHHLHHRFGIKPAVAT